jgi:hypothetical protein
MDINKELGLNEIKKEENTIIFESDPASVPKEFKDFDREIDQDISAPVPL